MTYQRTSLSLRVLMGVVCFILLTPALTGQEQEEKQETVYMANIVGVRGPMGGRSVRLTIRIQGYTSDEQVQEYLGMVQEGDQRQTELRRTLEKVRGLGRVSVTGFIGSELAVIRQHETEDGTLINLFTARNMSFVELKQSGRSRNYPFSFLQLLVDEEGKGQGTVIVAAKPRFKEDGTFELESLGVQPFQVINVQRED